MVHEVRLRDGAEAILRRPITDAEFTAFDAIYAGTSGTVDERLNSSFSTIVDSDSADNVRTVISFYQVFYGRQPDEGGLNYWTGLLDSGTITLNGLADEFSRASEFNARFGERQPVEVVAAQYANVLGRSPDPEGLAFWADQVADGQLSLADLGRFFATSDEAQARFDPFIDVFLINAANSAQDYDTDETLFQETLAPGIPTPGAEPIDLAGQTGAVNGGAGADVFAAESGDLSSNSNINGGVGDDTLTVFNETQGNAVSPRMQNVETVVWTEQTNDRDSDADNNVGGYGFNSTQVDVELDAGRITGVTRWEDFDSRADLVIEDIRDNNDVDGTFTGALTVAMVSTDPGNVDYATYFDDPTNRPSQDTSTIFIEVLDLDIADTTVEAIVNGDTPGLLTDARLRNFQFDYGEGADQSRINIVLDENDPRVFGTTATYNTLAAAIQQQIDANPLIADDLVVSLDGTFDEVASLDNVSNPGRVIYGVKIQINSLSGADLDVITRLVDSVSPSRAIAGRVDDAVNPVPDELIRLNIELDDVGKGSTGGDLLAGAMSTGRQPGDDGTSDSQGIERFDIEVDRSSSLQTINSTNNALEIVTIVNGENDGPNNTTTAADEQIGSLSVRGRANPDQTDDVNNSNPNIATDNAMPGALPQHDDFGFNDVRIIDASQMFGVVDLTLDLSNEIVEKYLDNDDTEPTANGDDMGFTYNLGRNSDEFLVNMAADALVDAGTASREDFNITVNGNAGNDAIVTNVGSAAKFIDGQGQDFYNLETVNVVSGNQWYANQANNNAASIQVTGGEGNDSIWTHGWGDAVISGGFGADTVYTDNSGTVNVTDTVLDIFDNLSRNIGEHDQIDYQVGAVWTFNDDLGGDGDVSNISGASNDGVILAGGPRVPGTIYNTGLTVSFLGAGGDANTAYTSTVTIPAGVITTSSGQVTDQVMTQAIKRAINDNDVLNKVLEAVDGPGQSLAVYSKIDGEFVSGDLSIDLFETTTVGGVTSARVDTSLANSAYDTSGASALSDFELFGGASTAESDNVIAIRADSAADVTVLSTNDLDPGDVDNVNGVLNGASNEDFTVEEGNFGTETIFNFGAGDQTTNDGAEDQFDFRAINYVAGTSGFGNGALNQGNNSVSILAETTGNDDLSEIGALFTTPNATAFEHIVIVYDNTSSDSDNTGTVYLVNNPSGTGGASATVQGEINLIGTDWSTLDADNFF